MHYLDTAIYLILTFFIFFLIISKRRSDQGKARLKVSMSRYKAYYAICSQWLKNKNNNKSTVSYFSERNIGSIAIYGLGELGSRFYEEIKASDISIAYFIDKGADMNKANVDGIPVIQPDSIKVQQDVDVIVVTPIYDFDEIEENLLAKNIELKIISLEDAVFETGL